MQPHLGSNSPRPSLPSTPVRCAIPRRAKCLHGTIPGSRLDVLPGAGHMIHHLDPGRMVWAVDLIANGGITKDTVRAESTTWGRPLNRPAPSSATETFGSWTSCVREGGTTWTCYALPIFVVEVDPLNRALRGA